MSILQDPRLNRLLGEVDDAKALLARGGDPSGEIAEALDSVYKDLGRHLHALVRAAEAARAEDGGGGGPAAGGTGLDDEDHHFESEGWYTDEVDGDALFGAGELGDPGETDVPADTDPGDLGLDAEAPAPQTDIEVLSLSDLQDDVLTGDLGMLNADEPPEWVLAVRSFVELLTPPENLDDPAAMPEEASRIQWAAGAVEQRLPGVPATVQVAVLGMLAARAHNLAAHLDIDIGPRRALDRLKRYRDLLDLPYPGGLAPGPHPERDTWARDALAFWELIKP